MGLLDFFKKINMAGGGRDAGKEMMAGIEALGLKVTSQKGAVAEAAGTFEGREAAMTVDGSKIMAAGNAAYFSAASTALAGAVGLISAEYQDWKERNHDFRSRDRMQNAQMLLRWAVFTPQPTPGAGNIGRDKSLGDPVGAGFYAAGDPAVRAALSQPAVQAALEGARCDEIVVKGNAVQAYWAPPMSEYQKVAASPEKFTQVTRDALTALCRLCDELCGPVR